MTKTTDKKLDLTVLEMIGNQDSDGVFFVFDFAAREFIYLSTTFESIWKRKVQEVMENPLILLDTIHPEDREHVEDKYRHFLKNQTKTCLSFRIELPPTTEKWIRLNVFPLGEAKKGHLVAGIAEDDSARKKSIFNMQKINARKNSMLEILSHDLRGPIGIVQSLAAVIEESLPESDKGQSRKKLQIIQEICKRNISLIQDLVHNEFLESAQVEMNKERVDLVWEFNEVIKNYRMAQENLAKEFKLTSSQEQIFFEIDSMKFMQVINNLISNSIKFTHDNGIIQAHIEKEKDAVIVSVSDNGIGIPKKYHPFLFDKFTKARRPGVKGEESVGLGMSIVKTIVEMHDGEIWFESEEKKGTTFYIRLPASE